MYFEIQMTRQLKYLARLLLSLNVLRRFHKVTGSVYRVFPAYTRYRKYCRDFQTYTRKNGRIRLQLKALQLLNINTPHSYYILDTNKGLITHKEAIKLGVGGLLLAIIR